MAAMNRSYFVIGFLIGLFIAVSVLALTAYDHARTIQMERTGASVPSANVYGKLRGGIIRLGPGCPCLHDTGDHAAVGITKVWADANGNLNITTDFDPRTEYLVTAHSDPDATMVTKRVNCGVSGGGMHSVIICARQDTGARLKATSRYYDPNRDNIWFWTWAVPR